MSSIPHALLGEYNKQQPRQIHVLSFRYFSLTQEYTYTDIHIYALNTTLASADFQAYYIASCPFWPHYIRHSLLTLLYVADSIASDT